MNGGCTGSTGVAHVAGTIDEEPTRCVYSVRRQQNMPLHDRIIPYLERAGLYHLARLNAHWFWLDEPLFRVLPADASEETVRIYARAYIMMLLSTQLFMDKSANRVHLRWLPFVARLDDMGSYSWGAAALAWLWATYLPSSDGKERRIIQYRLALDRLTHRDIVWEPYGSLDVLAVIHPEILTEEHNRLWRAVTSLIYFAVIEWHQVDKVFPQLRGVQHLPEPALNIEYLHSKDGRGGNRWFPTYCRTWHQHWDERVRFVLSVQRVPDPGPSPEYLDW
ncbi:serine/threonine-protein phosphatase 7 long form homolog [Arachis hypogaea]|uniref:serine/threonine-protein phosphatase 7 long form homolog n=1 Tax=Arachis hypogaea TaxID=3818 RepID=UPI003B21598A